MGGKQEGTRVSSSDEYIVSEKKLVSSSIKLTAPRSGFGVVNLAEFIYIIGGNDGFGKLYPFLL